MEISSDKLLPTLNFVLAIVGYQFVTSLAMPFIGVDVEGASNIVTVPYRLFSILLATTVIVQSLFKGFVVLKNNRTIVLFVVFWILWLIRLFFDLKIRTDFYILPREAARIWLFSLLLCLYNGFSVALSYKKIDLQLAYRLTAFALLISLIFSLLFNPLLLSSSEEIDTRVDGNVALTTITFGQMGMSAIVIGACMLFTERKLLLKYFVPFLLIVVGFLISLRSGSRGPLFCLAVIVMYAVITKTKRPIIGFMLAFLFLVLIVIFLRQILMIIAHIAPYLAERLEYTTSNEERALLLREGWERFLNNPITGDSFAITYIDGTYTYSHNMILDAFMGTGFFGGMVFLIMYISATIDGYKLLKFDRKQYMWVVFLLIQQMASGMLSGAFYLSPILSILIIFVGLASVNHSTEQKSLIYDHKQ